MNIDCLRGLGVIKGDLPVSYKQPPGLGRNQGWGLWADIRDQFLLELAKYLRAFVDSLKPVNEFVRNNHMRTSVQRVVLSRKFNKLI